MEEDNKAKSITTLSKVQKRSLGTHVLLKTTEADKNDAMFQHSVLCQTFLPYRDPGNNINLWQQKQGAATLAVQAGNSFDPNKQEFTQIGLPYGPKARLILAHINTEAIKSQQAEIHVEESMTAFIRKMGLNTDGRTIKVVKEQLRRISVATFSIGFVSEEGSTQADLKIVKSFDLWFPKDQNQRVMWDSTILLTDDYFNSLREHAIPLDERALAALSHSALGLDIYAWLAQRLHRISYERPQFIAWANLRDQFGHAYGEISKFKQVFRKTLKDVLMQYPGARIEEEANKGFKLFHSPPPIPTKVFSVIDGVAQKRLE